MDQFSSSPIRKGVRGEYTTPTRVKIRFMKQSGLSIRQISTKLRNDYGVKFPTSSIGNICRAAVSLIYKDYQRLIEDSLVTALIRNGPEDLGKRLIGLFDI